MSKPILTDRTELTTLAGEDWFHVIDTSNTADDPAGSSRKITAENIKSFISASNTVRAKIRFVGNTAITTISGVGQNTPINLNTTAEISLWKEY